MAKRFTPEEESILNSWARTEPSLRRGFPYTTASNTETRGLGFLLNKELDPGQFYIVVQQSDGLQRLDVTHILSFEAGSFYLTRTSDPFEIMVNFRGSAGSSGGGVTDHGALTGLGDDDHPQYARKNASENHFDGIITAEAFYMEDGGDLSAITRNITLQYPSRRDTITFFSAEADFDVTRMRAILRQNDSGFYPYVNFTLRHSPNFPSRLSGTELVTGGWQCGFYPGHPYLTADKNPLIVTSFNSNTIPKDSYVWLETTNLGEGNGIEEELAISLFLER